MQKFLIENLSDVNAPAPVLQFIYIFHQKYEFSREVCWITVLSSLEINIKFLRIKNWENKKKNFNGKKVFH